MMSFLSYIFWPNPGNADYTSPKVLLVFFLCIVLLLCALVVPRFPVPASSQLRRFRSSLVRSCGLFGGIGLFLIVARVEEIQYIAMRFWWFLWGISFFVYVFFLWRVYQRSSYAVLP